MRFFGGEGGIFHILSARKNKLTKGFKKSTEFE